VSYLGREEFAPAGARQAVLQERYGFDCSCARCQLEAQAPKQLQQQLLDTYRHVVQVGLVLVWGQVPHLLWLNQVLFGFVAMGLTASSCARCQLEALTPKQLQQQLLNTYIHVVQVGLASVLQLHVFSFVLIVSLQLCGTGTTAAGHLQACCVVASHHRLSMGALASVRFGVCMCLSAVAAPAVWSRWCRLLP
jgi:hypothetical protein